MQGYLTFIFCSVNSEHIYFCAFTLKHSCFLFMLRHTLTIVSATVLLWNSYPEASFDSGAEERSILHTGRHLRQLWCHRFPSSLITMTSHCCFWRPKFTHGWPSVARSRQNWPGLGPRLWLGHLHREQRQESREKVQIEKRQTRQEKTSQEE